MQSSPLAAQLLNELQGAPMQQMARQLGVDEGQAHGAVAMALPLLFGALGRNAQDGQGAQALLGALQRDHLPGAAQQSGGLDLGGVLGALLGGGAGSSAGASGGGAILGHIFGAGQERVEAGLGQASGLGGQTGQLLQMLAPIVMSFLAQHVHGNGIDAGGLGQMLGQERAQAAGSGAPGADLLGSLLDQDGDGQLGLGDLLKVGTSLLGGRR
jgi:hypothetical protein